MIGHFKSGYDWWSLVLVWMGFVIIPNAKSLETSEYLRGSAVFDAQTMSIAATSNNNNNNNSEDYRRKTQTLVKSNCSAVRSQDNYYSGELKLYYTYSVEFSAQTESQSLSGLEALITYSVMEAFVDACDLLDRPLYHVKTNMPHQFSKNGTRELQPGEKCSFRTLTFLPAPCVDFRVLRSLH